MSRYDGPSESWTTVNRSGGWIPSLRPVYTPDKLHFIVLTSLELKVFNLASKQCVRSYPLENSYDESDIYFHEPSSKVWVARKSGKIDIVDWREAPTKESAVSSTNVHKSIVRLVDVSDDEKRILAVSQHAFSLSLVEFVLEEGNTKQQEKSWNSRVIIKLNDNNIFAVSASKEYFGFYSPVKESKKVMTFIQLSPTDRSIVFERQVERAAPAVSMAISDEGVVAVGSVKGPIELYYDVFTKSSPAATPRSLKWHADAVFALEFALGGTYLLSGGRERVLVLWHLEDGQTQFLPRLEDEIKHISVSGDSELYALNLGKSEVLVLSALDLSSRLLVCGVKASFPELPGDAQIEKSRITKEGRTFKDEPMRDFSTRVYVDPRTKHVYFPTDERSHVQVFDASKGEQVSVFSVASAVQTGKVAIERQLITDPAIAHMAFSENGEWMATVDINLPPEVDELLSKADYEINLKMWRRGRDSWELVTRISSPHGINQQISSLVAVKDGFVTMSQNGSIRLWKQGIFNEEKNEVTWNVVKVVASVSEETSAFAAQNDADAGLDDAEDMVMTKFLQKYTSRKMKPIKNSPVAITFSNDGSLFVVAKRSSLYLYDAETYTQVGALPNILGSDVVALDIMQDSLLVALSTTRLVLYDLVNEREVWSTEISVPMTSSNLFAVDRINGRIAIALNHYQKSYHVGSLLCILGRESAVPLYLERVDRSPITSVKLIPSTGIFAYMDIHGHINEVQLSKNATRKQKIFNIEETFHAQVVEWSSERRQKALAEAEFTKALAEQAGQTTVLNINSFDAAFADDTASLSTLFNRVMRVISAK